MHNVIFQLQITSRTYALPAYSGLQYGNLSRPISYKIIKHHAFFFSNDHLSVIVNFRVGLIGDNRRDGRLHPRNIYCRKR